MADDDPEMTLVRLAKEEEGVGISMGAHLAGVKSAMLMQNHGFLAAINGIVSGAQLYRIPLLMLISARGSFGERDPWQTEGGLVTAHVLDALRIPHEHHRRAGGRRQKDRAGADAGVLVQPARGAAAGTQPDVGGLMLRRDAMAAVYDQPRTARRGGGHDHGRGGGGAAGHRASPELLLSAARDGPGRSLGLGIALSRPELRVVVLDGDGSLLMNLGGLTTLARYRPRNLVHVVFDNESLLSVGGFPTATSTGIRPRVDRRRRRRAAHGDGAHGGGFRRRHLPMRSRPATSRRSSPRWRRSVRRDSSPISRCSRIASSSSGISRAFALQEEPDHDGAERARRSAPQRRGSRDRPDAAAGTRDAGHRPAGHLRRRRPA